MPVSPVKFVRDELHRESVTEDQKRKRGERERERGREERGERENEEREMRALRGSRRD